MRNSRIAWFLTVIFVVGGLSCCLRAQMTSFDRGRAEGILEKVAADVRSHYYDPKFHGIDWDARVAETKQKIHNAKSFNFAMSQIAALLTSLDDSHTFFIPPEHAYHHDYGWQYQMVGDKCFVTRVRPGSDAEAKGLKPGDQVLSIDTYEPNRDVLWKMKYVFDTLRPQNELRIDLRDSNGTQHQLTAVAKTTVTQQVKDLTRGGGGNDIWGLWREREDAWHRFRPRFIEKGNDLLIVKLPNFSISEIDVDGIISRARNYKAMILDLRGNPGGNVETLKRFVSDVSEHEVKIGDRVRRKDTKAMIAKPGHNPFTGKIVVLVDSDSASAAELFARVMQLEKRGTVIGDQSSGSVMEAEFYAEHEGMDTVVFFAAEITEADLVMTDGKSLEHTGVIPDQIVLPTAPDLANGRDPVMVRAADVLGVKLDAHEAGQMFPYEWPKE